MCHDCTNPNSSKNLWKEIRIKKYAFVNKEFNALPEAMKEFAWKVFNEYENGNEYFVLTQVTQEKQQENHELRISAIAPGRGGIIMITAICQTANDGSGIILISNRETKLLFRLGVNQNDAETISTAIKASNVLPDYKDRSTVLATMFTRACKDSPTIFSKNDEWEQFRKKLHEFLSTYLGEPENA